MLEKSCSAENDVLLNRKALAMPALLLSVNIDYIFILLAAG
jgi:hypothetical protein